MVAVLDKLTQTPGKQESEGDTARRRGIMKRLLAGKVLGGPFTGRGERSKRGTHSFNPLDMEQVHVNDLLAKQRLQDGNDSELASDAIPASESMDTSTPKPSQSRTQEELPPLKILSGEELEKLYGREVYQNAHIGVAPGYRDLGPK